MGDKWTTKRQQQQQQQQQHLQHYLETHLEEVAV
mgnify:CR=1 FL=1